MLQVPKSIQDGVLSSLNESEASKIREHLESTYRRQIMEALRRTNGLQQCQLFDPAALQNLRRMTSSEPKPAQYVGSYEPMRVPGVLGTFEQRLDNNTSPKPRELKHVLANNALTNIHALSPQKLDQSSFEKSYHNNNIEHLGSVSPRLEDNISKLNNIPHKNTFNVPTSMFSPKSPVGSPNSSLARETLLTEDERLLFLKSASNISMGRSSPSDISSSSADIDLSRNRDKIPYNYVNNNNIFPFPPYSPISPVWPSILPFNSLTKLYSPFSPSIIPESISYPFDRMKGLNHSNNIKPPVYPFPMSVEYISKNENTNKKRLLDAILQVQRKSPPIDGMRIVSSPRLSSDGRRVVCSPAASVALSLPSHVVSSACSLTSSPSSMPIHGEQPIDLSVKRKRVEMIRPKSPKFEMSKNHLLNSPKFEIPKSNEIAFSQAPQTVVMETEEVADDREIKYSIEKHEQEFAKNVIVTGSSEIVNLKNNSERPPSLSPTNSFESPMKIIKLESSHDTLIV